MLKVMVRILIGITRGVRYSRGISSLNVNPPADFISSSRPSQLTSFAIRAAVHRTSIDCTIRRCVESLEKSATCTDNGTGLIRKVTPLQYSFTASTKLIVVHSSLPFLHQSAALASQDVLKLAKVKTGEMAVVKLSLVN